MKDKKMQLEGKKSGGAESTLKPVAVPKAASVGAAAKTPKPSGQI
tara:strand:- start:286 stop:420 length:135 start_codon:yes stop_codon:yes gene_type:complete